MDTTKTIDKVIAYNRNVQDVKCNNDSDLFVVITNDNKPEIKCLRFIKVLGKEDDENKDECPIGSIPLKNKNICVGDVYNSLCEEGYEKIDNKCYKKCEQDFVTVDIEKINYVRKDNGINCIRNTLGNQVFTPESTNEDDYTCTYNNSSLNNSNNINNDNNSSNSNNRNTTNNLSNRNLNNLINRGNYFTDTTIGTSPFNLNNNANQYDNSNLSNPMNLSGELLPVSGKRELINLDLDSKLLNEIQKLSKVK